MKIELSKRENNDGSGRSSVLVTTTIENNDSVTPGSQFVQEFDSGDFHSLGESESKGQRPGDEVTTSEDVNTEVKREPRKTKAEKKTDEVPAS